MAKFLDTFNLNSAIEKIFDDAFEELIIVSPYIKLHPRFVDSLRGRISEDKLKIIILFGKNEEDLTKSLDQTTFNFLKEFPNIEIRYEGKLHAKYYANELTAVITSMNLYDYSQNNNIEAGVLIKTKLFNPLSDDVDRDSQEYFDKIIYRSKTYFKNEPEYEKTNLGFSKRYVKSNNVIDLLTEKYLSSSKNVVKNNKPSNTLVNSSNKAYCIRTGTPILFNLDKPYCDAAFESWSKYKNEDFKEKYCHFSGEESNGETTKSKPILKKHWKEAKSIFNF
jgi:hypothetical protein